MTFVDNTQMHNDGTGDTDGSFGTDIVANRRRH